MSTPNTSDLMRKSLARRHRTEKWFKGAAFGSLAVAAAMLAVILGSIIKDGWTAFIETRIQLEVTFDPVTLGEPLDLATADFAGLYKDALKARFPDVSSRADKRKLYSLVSAGAADELRAMLVAEPKLLGQTRTVWLLASANADAVQKGIIDRRMPEDQRSVSDVEIKALDELAKAGALEQGFAARFFTSGDSREPELAGIAGALAGTMLTLAVTLALSFPLAIGAAIYLEEFAPKNRITEIIEININNLAAVPSIIYGLLGLAVYLIAFGLPRSAPLVGGLTLALMTLPMIIIAARSAIKAIPPSIREAALGLGASPMQVAFHHVLPLAMPGILTGTIIGMATALGETAPLLMIGMVAFIVDVPGAFTDAATVMPVQVYLWADSPERAFVAKTSAAILVLLAFLVVMNGLAVWLRQRFERRW